MESFQKALFKCIVDADENQLSLIFDLERFDLNLAKDARLYLSDRHRLEQMFSRLPKIWFEVVEAYLRCLSHVTDKNWKILFSESAGMFNAFLRLLQNGDASMLRLLYKACDNLWWCACRSPENIEEAARLLNRAFTNCLTDRQAQSSSRKWGVFEVFCKLMRAYFRLGQHRLCKNAVRALLASDLPDLEHIHLSQFASYQYYLGVHYFLDEEFCKAEECLLKSFDCMLACKDALKNQQ